MKKRSTKITKFVEDFCLQIGNFVRVTRIILGGFGKWPLWMKVGDEVTILSWGDGDESWCGQRCRIVRIDLPFVWFNPPTIFGAGIDTEYEAKADLRKVTFKKL